ncbi:MAG: hypothetical protein U0361_25130 [Nitrospiraceae bacterium]
MMQVECQGELLDVVLAINPRSHTANVLYGAEEKSEQKSDDGDDDKKLDQGESQATVTAATWHGRLPGNPNTTNGQINRTEIALVEMHTNVSRKWTRIFHVQLNGIVCHRPRQDVNMV